MEKFNLTRDGQIVLAGVEMSDALAYIHKNHSYSVSHAIKHEGYDLAEVKTEAQMLKDLKNARDYSYEATMSDYSMQSINHAQRGVEDATKALKDAGYEVPTW